MRALGEDFLAAAQVLGFEDAEGTIRAEDLAALLADPSIANFLEWFRDHASEFSVLKRPVVRSATNPRSAVDEVQSPVDEVPTCSTATALSQGSECPSMSTARSTSDSSDEEFLQLPRIQKFLFERQNRFFDEKIKMQTNYNRQLTHMVSECLEKLKNMQKKALSNDLGRCDFQLAYKCLSLTIDMRLAINQTIATILSFRLMSLKDLGIPSGTLAESANPTHITEISETLNELVGVLSQKHMRCPQQHARTYCNAVSLKILSAELCKAGMDGQLERLKWFSKELPAARADDLEKLFETVQKSNVELKEKFSSLFSRWRDQLVNRCTDMQVEHILEAYHSTELAHFSYWDERIKAIIKQWEFECEPVRRKVAYLNRRIEMYEAALAHVKSLEQSIDSIASLVCSLKGMMNSCAKDEAELEQLSDGYDSPRRCLPSMINEFGCKVSDGIIGYYMSSGAVRQEIVEMAQVETVKRLNKLLHRAQRQLDRLKLEIY